jgi:predicted anti-sigma-YlaC factor YlaD
MTCYRQVGASSPTGGMEVTIVTDMTCQEFVELVTAFLEGVRDPETERRLVAHVEMCGGCERYLEQFRHTIDTLGELPAEKLPKEVRDAIMDSFREE